MIGPREVLERRLLSALEQSAAVAMPESWRDLRPGSPETLRSAAAFLLRVADCASRNAMMKRLADTAQDVRKVREGRDGGEQELWLAVAAAIQGLDTPRPGAAGLLGLKLWGQGMPLAELDGALRDLLPTPPTIDETWLTAAARTLLRALAGRWIEDARRKAKP